MVFLMQVVLACALGALTYWLATRNYIGFYFGCLVFGPLLFVISYLFINYPSSRRYFSEPDTDGPLWIACLYGSIAGVVSLSLAGACFGFWLPRLLFPLIP
jgi:Na+/citrate or Na+/malate symporter